MATVMLGVEEVVVIGSIVAAAAATEISVKFAPSVSLAGFPYSVNLMKHGAGNYVFPFSKGAPILGIGYIPVGSTMKLSVIGTRMKPTQGIHGLSGTFHQL